MTLTKIMQRWQSGQMRTLGSSPFIAKLKFCDALQKPIAFAWFFFEKEKVLRSHQLKAEL
jgi:hypothetical protein